MSAKRSLVKINAAQKRQAVVEARAAGNTWRRCAEIAGYSSAESAMRAFSQACAMMPQQSVDDLVAQETVRLEECDQRLADLIACPPIKTTSIGRTQFDVRTCTCPVKARTDRDHAPDCQVQPVLDQGVVIAAIRERRLVGESLRRLRGADKPALPDPEVDGQVADALRYVRDIEADNRRLRDQVASLSEQLRFLSGAVPAELALDGPESVGARPGDAGPW